MKLNFTDQKQFLAEIRKMAKTRKISAQIMLQEVILDDLLERIANSKYKSNFILKGGFLIASLIGTDLRSTRDLDTSVIGLTVSKDTMQKIFEEICAIKLPEDNIILKILKIDDIRENDEYNGYRLHIKAYVYSSRVDIKVDISTGDVITERAIKYEHQLLLENRKIQIMAYNTETIIAEKLETVISRATFNTRLKDFYDLYIFDQKYYEIIDFDLLKKAIIATTNRRGTKDLIGSLISTLEMLKTNQNLESLWSKYQDRNSYSKNINFAETCNAAVHLVKKTGLK